MTTSRRHVLRAAAGLALLPPLAVLAEPVPAAAPGRPPHPGGADRAPGGFSRARLRRLTLGMTDYVSAGVVAGVQTLVWRDGALAQRDLIGWQDEAARVPMAAGTLFRIASMTKPVTSVAALMLLEEGRFQLEDPVDRWLPELAGRPVLKRPDGPLDETVPAARPITVQDLFLHTAGFASPLADSAGPIGTEIATLRGSASPDDFLARLGRLPLLEQPGTRLHYGACTDVLGFLVARVSGLPFEQFLQRRLFGPLGMADTGFHVPADTLDRLGPGYAPDPAVAPGPIGPTRRIVSDPAGAGSRYAKVPAYPSGAGGLISTGADYLRFARMLLDEGSLDGTRLLSRKTVQLMRANALSPEQRRHPFFGYDMWAASGFGLGVSVVEDIARFGEPASVGQYGWGGAHGTFWFNDPAERLVGLLMIQNAFGARAPRIQRDFRTLVYQAIDD